MRIIVAPDSFRGTLSSAEAAELLAQAAAEVFPSAEVVRVPVADGGEGTVDAWLAASGPGGRRVVATARDPLGRPVDAAFGLLPDGRTAVVETAAASGLALVGDVRDPERTTTLGTGDLVRAAFDRGCTGLVLGLGGSATNDGGAGFLVALGARILDELGRPVEPTGGGLADAAALDASGLDPRLARCDLRVACDVDNPLCGPQGASAVFGPQKGAGPDAVARLDRNLARWADLLEAACGRPVRDVPGAGAAGGLAAALLAFARPALVPGIGLLLDAVGFDRILRGADLVVTGEGRLDAQSLRGKAPVGVAARARAAGVRCIAVVGSVGAGWEGARERGIAAVHAARTDGAPLDAIRRTCREDLLRAASAAFRQEALDA